MTGPSGAPSPNQGRDFPLRKNPDVHFFQNGVILLHHEPEGIMQGRLMMVEFLTALGGLVLLGALVFELVRLI